MLPPSATADGAWRLVCNNVQGIYQYRSADGLRWARERRALWGAVGQETVCRAGESG